MDQSVDEERLGEYQNRVSAWIGEQGILFQLRYANIVGNYSITKQLGSLLIRLLIIIAAVVGIGYLILNRHFGSTSYREGLSEDLSKSLALEKIELEGFNRARGVGVFREINLEGGEGSFFIRGEIEDLSGPFSFFEGITKPWKPDQVRIRRASFQLKAGGAEDEMAKAFQLVTQSFEGEGIQEIEIEQLDFDWGYSKLTYGAITGTQFQADLVDGVWEVSLEGGLFSQNWLKNFEIVSGNALVTQEGIEIKSLELKMGSGTLDLQGMIAGSLGVPEFALSGHFNSLPLDRVISLSGVRIRDYLSGSISGNLTISGSSNRKVTTQGQVELEPEDRVTIRESWEILKTMSILDVNSSYRRVDFTDGRFDFATSDGGLEVTNLDLRSGDLMRLKGQCISRLPTQKEAADALGIILTEGIRSDIREDITDTSGAQTLENERISLRRATGGGVVNDLQLDLLQVDENGAPVYRRTGEASLSSKEMEERQLRYEMNVHRIKGEMELAVKAGAFVEYPSLQKLYPKDEEGWRWVPLSFDTTFSKITENEAEGIREDSRIQLKSAAESEQD